MINLKGKRALVCGGTSGIAKSTVDSLVENGADVVVLSRSASGDNTISCDLEDLDILRELVTKEIEENGNFHIFEQSLFEKAFSFDKRKAGIH